MQIAKLFSFLIFIFLVFAYLVILIVGKLTMSVEIKAAIIGGIIGISGGLLMTILNSYLQTGTYRKVIQNSIKAQLLFMKDKVERLKKTEIGKEELKAGQPLFKALADNIGYLSPEQAEASTKAFLTFFEFAEKGEENRCDKIIELCEKAIGKFK